MVLDSSFFIVHLAAYKRQTLFILIHLSASHVNSYELVIIMKVKDHSGLTRLRYESHSLGLNPTHQNVSLADLYTRTRDVVKHL